MLILVVRHTFISCLIVCMSLSSSSDSPRPACVSSKEEGESGDSKLLDLVILRIAILGLPVMLQFIREGIFHT